MDRINYNFDLVILIKHIIFTEPFIADGSVLYVLFRLTISALILSKMQTMSAIVPLTIS